MHLGVVMMGNGAHAAASAGVMQELEARGIEPCAVCGMQGGAAAAAMYLSGLGAKEMMDAASAASALRGKVMPAWPVAARRLKKPGAALLRPGGIERLLLEYGGHRLLPLCPRTGVILCRHLRTGHHVVFSSRSYEPERNTLLCMQVTTGFAARAAIAMPPFFSPMSWLGSSLLPESDVTFACRQLFLLGAQRVLVIAPALSVRSEPDALDLSGGLLLHGIEPDTRVAVLHVPMPDAVGAMAIHKTPACAEAGRMAAKRELDRLFNEMGMAFCRVLPFGRKNG